MPLDSATYRKVIGHFATGVTVVTTDVDGRLHGMTANAVSSVSLDPLLLLVCVSKRAVSHGEMSRARAFAVNILDAGQEDLADLFARRAEPTPESLRGIPFRRGPDGSPLLTGALAWLECATDASVEAGDHTIFLGRVTAGESRQDGQPLMYFRGGYRHGLI